MLKKLIDHKNVNNEFYEKKKKTENYLARNQVLRWCTLDLPLHLRALQPLIRTPSFLRKPKGWENNGEGLSGTTVGI